LSIIVNDEQSVELTHYGIDSRRTVIRKSIPDPETAHNHPGTTPWSQRSGGESGNLADTDSTGQPYSTDSRSSDVPATPESHTDGEETGAGSQPEMSSRAIAEAAGPGSEGDVPAVDASPEDGAYSVDVSDVELDWLRFEPVATSFTERLAPDTQ